MPATGINLSMKWHFKWDTKPTIADLCNSANLNFPFTAKETAIPLVRYLIEITHMDEAFKYVGNMSQIYKRAAWDMTLKQKYVPNGAKFVLAICCSSLWSLSYRLQRIMVGFVSTLNMLSLFSKTYRITSSIVTTWMSLFVFFFIWAD